MKSLLEFSRRALLLASPFAVSGCGRGSLPFEWPPQAGAEYPEIELRNLEGDLVNLASFRGKVLLIEPIGMT